MNTCEGKICDGSVERRGEEFEEAQEKEKRIREKIEDLGIELDDLDVEIGDNFSGSLNHLIDVASQKNSTTTTTTSVSAEDIPQRK